jgi:hypothetical protein
MKHFHALWVLLVLVLTVPARTATKDKQPPDREMLRMMEFLRQMEMIKQMDIMQDMHDVEGIAEEQVKNTSSSKPQPVGKKEAVK